MATVLIRGLARASHRHPIALQQFYTTRPSPKAASSDAGASKKSSAQNDKSSLPPSAETPQLPPSPSTAATKDEASAEQPTGGGRLEKRLTNFKAKLEESQRKVEHVREDIQGYALKRFVNYIKNYDQVLEKKFPGAMRVYRVFMDGVKLFGRDMVELLRIRKEIFIGDKDYENMTRREIEICHQMPQDLRKVGPLLLISSIPFAHYVTMPIAYMYPRHFLTHHFWTLQQRSEFAVINLRDRLMHSRPVLRHLQSNMASLKNDRHYERWRDILGKLGSGLHPTVEDILRVEPLFAEPPYKRQSLSYTHMNHLVGLYGIKSIFRRRFRLLDTARNLHHIDLAIIREGGASALPTDALRASCFTRGLNASNMPNDELIKFLDDWTNVSQYIDETNVSLYFHLPVLLAYNHPNNWKLIYHER